MCKVGYVKKIHYKIEVERLKLHKHNKSISIKIERTKKK